MRMGVESPVCSIFHTLNENSWSNESSAAGLSFEIFVLQSAHLHFFGVILSLKTFSLKISNNSLVWTLLNGKIICMQGLGPTLLLQILSGIRRGTGQKRQNNLIYRKITQQQE